MTGPCSCCESIRYSWSMYITCSCFISGNVLLRNVSSCSCLTPLSNPDRLWTAPNTSTVVQMQLFSICAFLDVSTIITPCTKQRCLHSATNFGCSLNGSHEAFSYIKGVNLWTCVVIHSGGYKKYRIPFCLNSCFTVHFDKYKAFFGQQMRFLLKT